MTRKMDLFVLAIFLDAIIYRKSHDVGTRVNLLFSDKYLILYINNEGNADNSVYRLDFYLNVKHFPIILWRISQPWFSAVRT